MAPKSEKEEPVVAQLPAEVLDLMRTQASTIKDLTARLERVESGGKGAPKVSKEQDLMLHWSEIEDFLTGKISKTEFYFLHVDGRGEFGLPLIERENKFTPNGQLDERPGVFLNFDTPPTGIGIDFKHWDPSKKWHVLWADIANCSEIKITEEDYAKYNLSPGIKLNLNGAYTIEEALTQMRLRYLNDPGVVFNKDRGGLCSGEMFRELARGIYEPARDRIIAAQKRDDLMQQINRAELAGGVLATMS